MIEQWQELRETITELRDNDGTGTQQEVCKFLINLMDVLEKQMQEPKTGHWYRKHSWEIFFTCSECGTTNASGTKYNYCPSCGARMVEREG